MAAGKGDEGGGARPSWKSPEKKGGHARASARA